MIVCDPSLLEEECCKGKMVIGVNAYREVCTLHLAGQVCLLRVDNIFFGKGFINELIGS